MRTVAILLVAAGVAASGPPSPVNFPGSAEAKDPTGRYAVAAVAPDGYGGGIQELLLKTVSTGQTRRLLAFPKSVTVFWSPDGNALAVTDHRSSDFATVLLYSPDRTDEIDLDAVLQKALGPLPERTQNQQVFLEVVRWLDAKRLRLRLHGRGTRDPEGFSELFDYELTGKFKRAIF